MQGTVQDALSTQIIIPQKQVGRNSDIYVTMVSYTTQVASKGWFIAMISTTVETDNPEAEIQPGLNLLGPIKQKIIQVWSLILLFPSNLRLSHAGERRVPANRRRDRHAALHLQVLRRHLTFRDNLPGMYSYCFVTNINTCSYFE